MGKSRNTDKYGKYRQYSSGKNKSKNNGNRPPDARPDPVDARDDQKNWD
jgi:hypothetical protein